MSGAKKQNASAPFKSTEQQQLNQIGGFSPCLGYQKLAVSDASVETLTLPANTGYALLTVIADPATSDANKDRVIYFREDGEDPETGDSPDGDGFPLGDLGVYEVKGALNLRNFKMIGIRAGETHDVRVQYFA